MPRRDLHPIHARGLRSPDLTRLVCRGRLTDADIHRYALTGRYGKERQEEARRADKKPVKRTSSLARALALLKSL